MEVVNANYLPGDPMLVDRIVYELKSQGIFDQFRKECIADVDTKPAYQNLRQRVEGSVAGFLRKQKWNPEMNKNQVREMLRKSIYESGFLETGVERIVNQVVNPKIEKVFQPKVAEIVYKYLGIEKPKKENAEKKNLLAAPENLLPTDLEAVSPESETIERKHDKSFDSQTLDDSKNDDDESPPFEPLEEQPAFLPAEENSVDSHLSGFSGLASHDSYSNENMKIVEPDVYNQDSQISKHSFDEHVGLSISEDNETKLEGGDDSRASKSSKSRDSPIKNIEFSPDLIDKGSNSSKTSIKKDKTKLDDKNKTEKKSDSHKHKSRHDSRSESKNDKRSDKKDSKERHKDSKDSRDSSKDSRERRDSKSSNHNNRDKEKRTSSSGNSKHSNRDRSSSKKETSSKDEKHKASHRDDSKRSSKTDKYRKDDRNHRSHSSSSKSDRDRGTNKKDSKRENKDDHFSSKTKKSDRRSTDRDSNDGQSGNSGNASAPPSDNSNIQQSNKQQDNTNSTSGSGSNDSSTSDNVEQASTLQENININENCSMIKLIKPKFASNIHEARKLMKIRKQLRKLEKRIYENSVTSATNEAQPVLDMDVSKAAEPIKNEPVSSKFNNSVSAAAWDAIEAKLNADFDFNSYMDDSDNIPTDAEEDCLYLPNDVPAETMRCKIFIENLMDSYYQELSNSSRYASPTLIQKENDHKGIKRKMYNLENDLENNNKKYSHLIETHDQLFFLPLSPAESDIFIDKQICSTNVIEKHKKEHQKGKANQRYSSDDLYKPRLFNGSRRRTGKLDAVE